MEFVFIIVGAIFVNNVVLSQFLGICPFLGVSSKVSTSMGMGAAVTFVMTIASVVVYLLQNYVLVPLGITLSPMLGAAAMSMSSVFVVTNALRLRYFKAEKREIKEEIHPEIEIIEEETMMETVIYVNGMMCPHCKAMVEKVCKAVPGTTDAVVDLQAKNVTVTGEADVAVLKKAIADAGYEVVE